MRTKRFGLSAAAVAVLVAVLATPAQADPALPVDINDAHLGSTAAGFGSQDCSGPFANLPDGKDGWHFIVPDSAGEGFISLTVIYEKSDDTKVTVVLPDSPAGTVHNGAGWSGWFAEAGGKKKHAYVITDEGWTLDAAAAFLFNVQTGAFFNLSHTCASDDPGTSPSPSPSPSPSASASASTSASASASTPPGGTLPRTGASIGAILAVGAGLIAAGAALLALRRRRDLTESV